MRAAFRITLGLALAVMAPRAWAQGSGTVEPGVDRVVDVTPVARDEQIRDRLHGILIATQWFEEIDIRVQDGVVFLAGLADSDAHRTWAADLSRRTQGVVAVVDRLELPAPSVSSFAPAIEGMKDLGKTIVGALPFVVFALVVLLIAWGISRIAMKLARHALSKRSVAPLLREVLSKVVGAIVIIIGLYVVFRIAGLTAVALSVVGGTGLLGLILGIAFRDITESFLASIFPSLHPPFRTDDLLSIGDHVGYVERLRSRATAMTSSDQEHVNEQRES
jgi:hypothetical protein